MSGSVARCGIVRHLYLLVAVCSLGSGIIGMVLPLWPTTPFLLLAAWAGSRGCPRFHHWLCRHRWFGPPIAAWHRERAVPLAAKVGATLMLAISWLVLLLADIPAAAMVAASLLFAIIAGLVWTRPPPTRHPTELPP